MREEEQILRFNTELDRLLGILPAAPTATAPEGWDGSDGALEAAAWLLQVDFRSELHPRPGLPARWITGFRRLEEKPRPVVPLLRSRWTWAALAVVLALAALFIFRQPVLAAMGRLFGYGYLPQAGFIPLEGTRFLNNPVRQEHAGRSLTVTLGVATSTRTILWLEESEPTRGADGAWLETPSGERLSLTTWTGEPTRPGGRGARLEFPPLLAGVERVTLALPEGWRLPLEWIPAAGAGLPATDVRAPYPTPATTAMPGSATVPTAGSESPTQTPQAAAPPCAEVRGLRVCLAAAQTDEKGTRLLLEATSTDPQFVPGGDSGQFTLPNPVSDEQEISLTDDLGNVTRLETPLDPVQWDGERLLRPLTFPPPAAQARQLTLRVPAFEASLTFADPLELSVDLGADPQPGQALAVDQELTVLGQTLRFRQASLVGDGASSLHVSLTSDPLEGGKDVIVWGLDLGKPEGIDDGYGSGGGGPQGVVKLFSELVGPVSGKKTGKLTFPILGARLLLLGPFEFTFSAPATVPAVTQTLQVVGGESFSPLPTPTSLPLDSYRYKGKAIQPGELLFTAVGPATTALYAANPHSGAAPEWVATLPGQVYQVYLHPDRLGIDYLAGTQERDAPAGMVFYRATHLYTLRFADAQPRLLAAFPRAPENHQGTELTANWSYDGRFVIFQRSHFDPGQGTIGWIDLACRQSGECRPRYLEIPSSMELNRPRFSPDSYRVLISGMEGVRLPDVYLFELDNHGDPGALTNLTHSDQTEELYPSWLPDGGGFMSVCRETVMPIDEYDLCLYGVDPGAGQHVVHLPGNMQGVTFSPDGKRLADYGYIQNREQIRVLEWETGKTTLIPGEGDWPFFGFAFSPDGESLALLGAGSHENEPGQGAAVQVSLYSFTDDTETLVFDSGGLGIISWLGWAQ
ncbi:MAG: hypothetical protein PHQ40_17660 [Anaerolineaceae bacterium]|nr:hypothetical protein [Anaerolineaceae bacterium]